MAFCTLFGCAYARALCKPCSGGVDFRWTKDAASAADVLGYRAGKTRVNPGSEP